MYEAFLDVAIGHRQRSMRSATFTSGTAEGMMTCALHMHDVRGAVLGCAVHEEKNMLGDDLEKLCWRARGRRSSPTSAQRHRHSLALFGFVQRAR